MTNRYKPIQLDVAAIKGTVIAVASTGPGGTGGGVNPHTVNPKKVEAVHRFVDYYAYRHGRPGPWPDPGPLLAKDAPDDVRATGLLIAAALFNNAARDAWDRSGYRDLFDHAARRLSDAGQELLAVGT